jgi:hypothetical protein
VNVLKVVNVSYEVIAWARNSTVNVILRIYLLFIIIQHSSFIIHHSFSFIISQLIIIIINMFFDELQIYSSCIRTTDIKCSVFAFSFVVTLLINFMMMRITVAEMSLLLSMNLWTCLMCYSCVRTLCTRMCRMF